MTRHGGCDDNSNRNIDGGHQGSVLMENHTGLFSAGVAGAKMEVCIFCYPSDFKRRKCELFFFLSQSRFTKMSIGHPIGEENVFPSGGSKTEKGQI